MYFNEGKFYLKQHRLENVNNNNVLYTDLITRLYGPTEYTGPMGPQGGTGYTGPIGFQGFTGQTGPIGTQGFTGYTGSI
jgi:hypothetical protein